MTDEIKAASAPSSLAGGEVMEIIETLEALTKRQVFDAFDRGARAARLDALDMIRPLAALTPRHEAPAEGAGEREEVARTLWISRGGLDRLFDEGATWKSGNGFRERRQCFIDADAVLALRARSSAPEAREVEGEAVAWVSPGQLATLKDPEYERGEYLPVRKTRAGQFTQPLYAAPSADKLRPVVEGFVSDLTGSLKNRSTMLTINHNVLTARIDQALAALKA